MTIQAGLIEKDYWIMHVLYGLQKSGYHFELKGGTSLSKGYRIIDRFSEDIDIRIQPREDQDVDTNPKHEKEKQVESRKNFYDQLTKEIKIDGIESIIRDEAFDDPMGKFRSGGIRLLYKSHFPSVDGVKEGILLEVGFDTITPNHPITISSWAFDAALKAIGDSVIDNRSVDVLCYHPGYTFVEKLQTIATKFRREQESGDEGPNFIRHYYDVSQLLTLKEVLDFMGTEEYYKHKADRFPNKDQENPISRNEAFLLNDPELRAQFKGRYLKTRNLYYKGQPDFDAVLKILHKYIDKL